MLFTAVLALLSFYQSVRHKQMVRAVYQAVRGVVGSVRHSVKISRLSSSQPPRLAPQQHDLIFSDTLITSLRPQLSVDLTNEWTSYLNNQSLETPDNVYLLMEATHPTDKDTYLEETLTSNHKLTDYVRPLAWRAGYPFSIVANCCVTELVRLTVDFIEGEVDLGDLLELHSITTVKVEGSAAKLLRVESGIGPSSTAAAADSPRKAHATIDRETKHPTCISLQCGSIQSVDVDSFHGSNEFLADVSLAEQLTNQMSEPEDEWGGGELESAGEALSGSVADLAPELVTPVKKSVHGKPPNVLVWCGGEQDEFKQLSDSLLHFLNPDMYVIYELKPEHVASSPWRDNTALLVLAGSGADFPEFLDYFLSGGTVISFGNSFDGHFVSTHCDSSQTHQLISMDYKGLDVSWTDLTVIGEAGRYVSLASNVSDATLSSLAVETGSGSLLAVEATHELNSGVAILSQARLDKDPSVWAHSQTDFARLKQSNAGRCAVLTDWLKRLGMECGTSHQPAPTPYTLLAPNTVKKSTFLSTIFSKFPDHTISTGARKVQFKSSPDDITSSDEVMTVLTSVTHDTAADFNLDVYRKHLRAETLGQVVLYSDVVTSTMHIIDSLMLHLPADVGVLAVANRQTSGQGRGGNVWLSPAGCAMFSLHLPIPLASQLGQRSAYIQHMVALAVVEAVRSLPGYQGIDLRLKWPNDIYAGGSGLKLGGVIVKSSVMRETIHCNIGCGVNLSNKNPTICINDLILQHNTQYGTDLPPLSCEQLLAGAMTQLEKLVHNFQVKGHESVTPLYYTRWLHSGARVVVQREDGSRESVTITGLDLYGFLSVTDSHGQTSSVHPDGNSFDMMSNLIVPKQR